MYQIYWLLKTAFIQSYNHKLMMDSNQSFLGNETPAQLDQTQQIWNQSLKRLKQSMRGTEEEKEHILRKRLLKFFNNNHLQKQSFYVQRREATMSSSQEVQKNSMLIYGIDFMSHEKIRDYFATFAVQIVYFDDSHCMITFTSSVQLYEAIKKYHCQNLVQSLQKALQNLQWIQLNPYKQFIFERRLCGRLVTSKDLMQKQTVQRSSHHDAYMLARNRFLKDMSKIDNSKRFPEKRERQRQRQREGGFDFDFEKSMSRSRQKKRGNCICYNMIKNIVHQVAREEEINPFKDRRSNYKARNFGSGWASDQRYSKVEPRRQRIERRRQEFPKMMKSNKILASLESIQPIRKQPSNEEDSMLNGLIGDMEKHGIYDDKGMENEADFSVFDVDEEF